MKKTKKVSKTKSKSYHAHHNTRAIENNDILGVDKDFVLIAGGAFVIVSIAMLLLYWF